MYNSCCYRTDLWTRFFDKDRTHINGSMIVAVLRSDKLATPGTVRESRGNNSKRLYLSEVMISVQLIRLLIQISSLSHTMREYAHANIKTLSLKIAGIMPLCTNRIHWSVSQNAVTVGCRAVHYMFAVNTLLVQWFVYLFLRNVINC
jgi:hypothetical protein